MKAIIVVEFDDEWLNRINTTCDEMFADVTIYKKESLEKQCDYSQRIYRCWCPLKPMPEKKPISQDRGKNHCEYSLLDRLEYQKGWNDCIDMLLGEENEQKT